jgi:hypothetical protein
MKDTLLQNRYKFLILSGLVILKIGFFQTKFIEKIETYTRISCSVTFFDNRAVYEIMWQILADLDRPHMTIRHLHISCWIPKAKNKHP